MTYRLTITLPLQRISYTAIGNRDALLDAAYDAYGVCGISLRPL